MNKLGSDTRLEDLGRLADLTRGRVDLVDPMNLDFSALISSSMLACNVVLKGKQKQNTNINKHTHKQT